MSDVTRNLAAIEQGDPHDAERLRLLIGYGKLDGIEWVQLFSWRAGG
jgi:hypothetical protein